MERENALPMTSFYKTPANLRAAKPGTLLNRENADGYALPAGSRAVRILYRSLDADGHPVATSGVILVPGGTPPKDGWPVIAWAHGTSGVNRACAPSLMKDVYYGEEGLMPMVRAGFAVVASDYHGLGTSGRHQYINKTAQAQDVIYAVDAARAADPSLGRRWVVDGHSQGGLAAWAVAEFEARLKDPGYLGAVSVAGAIDIDHLLQGINGVKEIGFYLPFMAFGIHARSPAFDPHDMLAGAALERYEDVTAHGCWLYGYGSFADAPAGDMLKKGWERNPWVERFKRDNRVGDQPTQGPMLVIAGEADHSVPIESVRSAAAKACQHGLNVTLRTYPGLDHDPVMEQSAPDQLEWIRDRFAGKPAGSGC
ncbi:MAG: alpha/beta hydrolase [Burkholderiaceae bacterium]|nr:alpha/beta hydrolase [Burkholderiaceae bacterium]